jgi:hypothetical protein
MREATRFPSGAQHFLLRCGRHFTSLVALPAGAASSAMPECLDAVDERIERRRVDDPIVTKPYA